MDEYLEQVPSSSWLDGVGSMVVDAIEPSQNFSRMMPSVVELMGETENQALYSNKHQDAFFDTHQDHVQLRDLSEQPLDSDGMVQPLLRQSPQSHSFVGCSWQEPIGGVARPAMGIQGRSRAFPSEEEISNDFFSGKRIRGNNVVSMGNGAQPQENGERVLSVVTNGPTKPRVRARRGQATDPHSIAERNRRDRIAERMKALQELVPDSNKTDKASMLDEIISYVKFLQMQVKCLSMCRLGGTAVAAPLLADLPVEEYANLITANFAQANGMAVASQDGIAFTERQVARLMDEDTSAAMQYLQSKGLCLMPISLATAISSTGTTTQVTLSKTENADGGKKESTVVQAFAANNSTTVGNNNLVNLHDSLCKEKL